MATVALNAGLAFTVERTTRTWLSKVACILDSIPLPNGRLHDSQEDERARNRRHSKENIWHTTKQQKICSARQLRQAPHPCHPAMINPSNATSVYIHHSNASVLWRETGFTNFVHPYVPMLKVRRYTSWTARPYCYDRRAWLNDTHPLALWIHAVDTGIAKLSEVIGDALPRPLLWKTPRRSEQPSQ
jgi:hypothetical protein